MTTVAYNASWPQGIEAKLALSMAVSILNRPVGGMLPPLLDVGDQSISVRGLALLYSQRDSLAGAVARTLSTRENVRRVIEPIFSGIYDADDANRAATGLADERDSAAAGSDIPAFRASMADTQCPAYNLLLQSRVRASHLSDEGRIRQLVVDGLRVAGG